MSQTPSSLPTDSKATAEAELRPELKPIAERYGREMLDFAVRVAGANTVLDWLQVYSLTHSKVKPQVMLLMDAQSHFCNLIMASKGWKWDDLIGCMTDISRAAALAHPAGHG